MRLDIDGASISAANVSGMKQQLDMRYASFSTSFNHADKATVSYTYYALRQLPYTVLMDVEVMAKKDIVISSASVMEAPDALKDVQNYYNEIDRPHVVLSLLTSSAKSPTGKLTMCASNTFLFTEPHGQEPRVIHEMWDNNMHLVKFGRKIKAGETYKFSIAGSSITSAHSSAATTLLMSYLPGPFLSTRLAQKSAVADNIGHPFSRNHVLSCVTQ